MSKEDGEENIRTLSITLFILGLLLRPDDCIHHRVAKLRSRSHRIIFTRKEGKEKNDINVNFPPKREETKQRHR